MGPGIVYSGVCVFIVVIVSRTRGGCSSIVYSKDWTIVAFLKDWRWCIAKETTGQRLENSMGDCQIDKENRKVRSAFWPPAITQLLGICHWNWPIWSIHLLETISGHCLKFQKEVDINMLLSLPISAKPLLPFSSIYKHSQLPHEEEHKMCLDMVWVLIWGYSSFLQYSFFLMERVTFFCSIIGKVAGVPSAASSSKGKPKLLRNWDGWQQGKEHQVLFRV
jgi:hypothetical protein